MRRVDCADTSATARRCGDVRRVARRFNATGAAQAQPTVGYDFEISASVCIPSSATTAPPGVAAPRLICTVRVLINADTGSTLGTTELFG